MGWGLQNMTEKTLEQWRLEIRTIGRKQWNVFYQSFLDKPISNYPRFYKALNLYGDWALFEAILSASNQDLTGDPLNYVLKVTHNMWKEKQMELEASETYQKEIDEAVKESKSQNERLAKKLKRMEATIADNTV